MATAPAPAAPPKLEIIPPASYAPPAKSKDLTFVDTEVEGADAWFPRFDESEWRITSRALHPADVKHAHAFEDVDYEK